MKYMISMLMGMLYRIKCQLFNNRVSIGDRLLLEKKLTISGTGVVTIGCDCVIGGIAGESDKYVTIDTHQPSAVIRIGNNVSLYATRISSKYEIIIGDNVLIEDAGILDTDFHSIDRDRGDPIGESYEKCKISIGNNVCIGVNSLITKGVTIGNNVIVMPGSVVSTSVKSDSIVGGNPARPIKSSVSQAS
jgi:acetyltransferase-like isoleucine patch superfamily enzyme